MKQHLKSTAKLVSASGTLTDPYVVKTARSTLTVEHPGHGLNFGDEVRYRGAIEIPGTGMLIEGPYKVCLVIDADHYAIEHLAAALADGRGGGVVEYEYERLPLDPNLSEADGFGAGGFGSGDYDE